MTTPQQTTTGTGAYTPAAESSKGYKAAVAASFLGWTLDAFDFFVLSFALVHIAAEFGVPDSAIAKATAVTLWFRPVGALLFGLLADRIGRKKTLMANLVFFSIFGVATGFARSYTMFMVLRALFGIGMGGEWGVGSSLAMEKTPKEQRGFVSGLLQEGYAAGNLLAAIVAFFVLDRWGWRAMFWVGGVPALLAIYVRTYVHESEVWERTRTRDFGLYARQIFSHWKLFVYLFVLLTFMGFVSHGTQDMYPVLLKRDFSFTTKQIATVTMIANVGAILGGILFGHFSDRLGRRKAAVAALVMAIVVVPVWAFSSTIGFLMLGGFLMQFMVQGAWGVVPAHVNELAPDSVRGFLPGFAYQCGMAAAGMVSVIEALFTERLHVTYAYAMAGTAVTVFVLAGIAMWFGKERRGQEFGEVAAPAV